MTSQEGDYWERLREQHSEKELHDVLEFVPKWQETPEQEAEGLLRWEEASRFRRVSYLGRKFFHREYADTLRKVWELDDDWDRAVFGCAWNSEFWGWK